MRSTPEVCELDRRVAVEVMKEPEPDGPAPEPIYMGLAGGVGHMLSEGQNWQGVEVFGEKEPAYIARLGIEWQPVAFSTSFEYAMRALNFYFESISGEYGFHSLDINYGWINYDLLQAGPPPPWTLRFYLPEGGGASKKFVATADTLPAAICGLLVDLAEYDRGV